MELTRREIDGELKLAFEIYERREIERSDLIIGLTTSEDDFVGTLANRFSEQRNKREAALEYLIKLVREDADRKR